MSPYLNICLSIGYLWVYVGIGEGDAINVII